VLKKLSEKLFGSQRKERGLIPEYLSNQDLTAEMIPSRMSTWHEIVLFSLSFNGYQKTGSFNRCTETPYTRDCKTLSEMRACLYFEQRHRAGAGRPPDKETMDFVHDLLDRMREKVTKNERD